MITAGALQSNHARQTAAAAAKTGLAAHLILFETVGYDDPAYKTSGNLLLDNILGAQVHLRRHSLSHSCWRFERNWLDRLRTGLSGDPRAS